MTRFRHLLLLATLAPALTTCARTECADPDYTEAECRVLAENELARRRISTGVEVRFQDPEAMDADSWEALGVVEERAGGTVRARVVGPGAFAMTFEAEEDGPGSIQVTLENVDPRMQLFFETSTDAGVFPMADPATTTRVLNLALPADDVLWLRGRWAEEECPESFRLLALGDIQTNPFQFERIVEHIALEHENAPEARPVLGLLVLGDLTELSTDVEFELVADLFATLPIPVAATPGNHDVFASSRAIYNRTFGPGNYALDVCNTRVVMLDTGNGALARSVQGRLVELLGMGQRGPVLVGTHYPPYPGLTGNGWAREDQAQHLLVEAAVASTDLVLAGHVHALLEFPEIDVAGRTLREIITGTAGADQGLAVPRYGYLRITIEGDSVKTCFVEVPPAGTGEDRNPPVSASLPNCSEG